jgi:eukaryotic-like serine/threonine-protein kinase
MHERWQLQAIAIWERESGADSSFLGYPLTTIDESYVDDGQPALAIPYLERALRIREVKHPDAYLLGETRFALARAFWESNLALDRAITLAEKARSDHDTSRIAQKQKADIDGWLDMHSPRRCALTHRLRASWALRAGRRAIP